jgi:dihydroorotate dehydrogenase
MSNGYERFVRPILFSLDPETAHDFVIASLGAASHVDVVQRALKRFAPAPRPKTVFGVTFPNPIGLAAGFDKNGVALPAWAALGFGFIEIGTVTAQPQPGNPKPRVFRLSQELTLINRLGFNSDGADAIASRLATLHASGRWPAVPIGINIGKARDTPLENTAQDYLYCFHKLHPFADYIALNISSPNTPGLRSLQDRHLLSPLLRTIQQANAQSRKPILIKIAPDLAEPQLGEMIAVCEENQIAGIIATNTTTDHALVPAAVDQEGGLSGAPLREKSTAVVRAIRTRSSIPIIGCGGISDGAAAHEKFTAGAQLVQVYTGYVFRGPGLLREIAEEL